VLAVPGEVVELGRAAGAQEIDAALARMGSAMTHPDRVSEREGSPPFRGGWIGSLSYDLGRRLELAVGGGDGVGLDEGGEKRSDWPLMWWARCDQALVFDNLERRWWQVGAGSEWAREERYEPRGFALGELASQVGQQEFEQGVGRVLEYIRAGDVYQVNLSHRLRAEFQGSTRGLFLRLIESAAPWYGAYLELFGVGQRRRSLLSASPEMFVSFDPGTRQLVTRPMKGTRAGRGEEARRALIASGKDAAELNMIVDLMRNDLGRVCALGSVRVERPREIERHGGEGGGGNGGLLQATATVSGRLREGQGLMEVVRALFPAGSVTGAPKIRAMQIIDELESGSRGPYCGAIGYVSDHGRACFNVAIRTAMVDGSPPGQGADEALDEVRDGVLEYRVGAGIVAESNPAAEWRETLDKAAVVLALARTAQQGARPRRGG